MSEQSGGPGWWQASDGKWYPPPAPTGAAPAPDPTQAQPTAGAPAYGAPAYGAPAAGGMAAGGVAAGGAAAGGGPGKIIAIVVVLALVAGGGAYLLTKGGGGGGSTASYCDNVKKFQGDTSLTNAFDDPTKIDQALAAFDVFAKSAPSDIKADMNTLDDAIKKIGAAVKSAGSDPSKQFGAILAASAALDENKLKAAQQHVETFTKDKCGVDFGSSNDSSTSDSSFSFSSFTFDSSSFESSLSSLSSQFSTFDTDSFSSELSSACSQFGSDFCSDLSSSS